jgi:predicted TIM-barrel fold metal-dependent hydrolase
MATGWPAYHIEFHTGSYPQAFQAQLASLVYSGAFERFPNLQFVLEEGGIGWVPALLWRLDRTWRAMREFAPHLDRLPSEVVREHFWFTTQPFDEPETHEYLVQLLECVDMNDRIMFSSDYPHWDMDEPYRVLPMSVIGPEAHEQIMGGNARRLFGFGNR